MKDVVSSLWVWLISWGVVGLCMIAVVCLCWRCGYPLKHRIPPSVDAIVTTVLGTILAVSGIKLVYNVRSMSAADSLYVPVLVAGFVLVFMGLKSLTRGFKTAISESLSPPPKKTDDEDDLSPQNLESGPDKNKEE